GVLLRRLRAEAGVAEHLLRVGELTPGDVRDRDRAGRRGDHEVHARAVADGAAGGRGLRQDGAGILRLVLPLRRLVDHEAARLEGLTGLVDLDALDVGHLHVAGGEAHHDLRALLDGRAALRIRGGDGARLLRDVL